MAITNAIEVIALIMIIVAVIKMIVLLIKPQAWMNFAKGMLGKKVLTQIVGVVLAAVVLYYLIGAGMTIVEILAATTFVALLLVVGLAQHTDDLVKKYQAQIKRGNLWKENWLYALLWIIILVWGAKELFM